MNEEETIKEAISWLSALDIKSECEATNKEIILNYINELQERNEYLEESDYAWHQLMKIKNKREYRSKFLKEFQAEFGKNTMPDYDEIYKRYDKQKK